MKKINIPKFIAFIALSILFIGNVNGQTYIYEDFESGIKPANWTYIKYSTTAEWEYLDGGYSTTGVPGTGHPQYSKEGLVNAMFHLESFSGQRVKLVTPPIDLSFGIKPELKFWHAQDERFTFSQWRNDELRVFYKEHTDSAWKQLAEYTEKVNVWTERTIQLPDSTLSGTYYLAFEGKTNNGYGVCIDSVILVEKGVVPKYIESINVNQASVSFVATESKTNPILRIDFTIRGNDGILKLDSLAVKSLNTDDSDIIPNGVKLFASDNTVFSNSTQIGSGKSFVGGTLSFTNINRILPTGVSSVWITYDIAVDVDHEKHEHILDAQIIKENIKINSSYYPSVDKSPTGSRTLYESILYDDFETSNGWIYTGEFERAIPIGLGGLTKGAPDPTFAVSGDYIIGTDITGLGITAGDYENNLTDKEYTAVSPYRNCKYYNDIYLYYDRWFNIDTYDTATVDFNKQTANNWSTFWQSSGTSINNEWATVQFNVNSAISRSDSVQVRFTLGPSNSFWNYSGWNIDNVVLVGNYITKDVGVTNWIGPLSGCGHTSEEYVEITITNFAGESLTDPLPVSYSFDGGVTLKYDTIYTTIPMGGSINYTIDKPVNLTTPGWYNNVYATTNLTGDEYTINNKINKTIFITPTYTLPYSQNFETNYGYYLTGGTNSSWAYGTPAGIIINTAASGTKAWVTKLAGNYNNSENSYLESPCFNFSAKDSIVFEFKCKGLSEENTDGLSLMYSFNDGATWNPVPNKHDYYWNWYNETNISELGLPGIDTTNGQWLTFRQLLPSEFSNQSSVKFRFVFESNESINYEGFGIDDIKIYETPYDVGVTSLIYPYNRCEWSDTTHVKVLVKNFGPIAVKSGTKIPLVMQFNTSTIKDTLTLTSDLSSEATKLFTFNSTVNMSTAGDYNFTINTKLESNTYFYNDTLSNDTLYSTVSVTGMPGYNPFQDIIGDNPVDTLLDAGAGYTGYLWQDNSTNQTYQVLLQGIYKVTVSNANGCSASDSVEVINSELDLAMDTIYTELADSCERTVLTEISVRFKNNSFDNLEINDTVALAYRINSLPIVRDTLFVTSQILVGGTEDFTFPVKADFTEPRDYSLKVFTDFLKDLNHADDSITINFNTWGYVEIELAYDTIFSSQADTLELIATPGYTDYLWNTLETTSTISPSTNESNWYIVNVSDANVCGTDKDSTYIETYDFGINSIVSPVSACTHSSSTNVEISIRNYSGNTYTIGTKIPFAFNFENSGWIKDSVILTSNFDPLTNKTLTLPTTINSSAVGEYNLDVKINSSIDADLSNDTLNYTFETWGYPDVELAYDTIYTTQADTVVLLPTLGYDTYLWSDASTNDTLVVTNNYSENYVVTVTDVHGCGTDSDSTRIFTYNFGLKSLDLPKNACSHSTSSSVKITVENLSNDIIPLGSFIDVVFIFNGGAPVYETATLTSDLYPSQSFTYTFIQKVDMSAIGSYTLKSFVDFEYDVDRENDTINEQIRTYGFPTVEIGPDIYTYQPDTVKIVANPGYNFYSWNEGTKNDTLFVTKPESFNYVVTVTDINGCSTSDNLTVYTTDIGALALISPINSCELSNAEIVTVQVRNNCLDTIFNGESITVSYKIGNGSLITENFDLSSDLLPDQTVDHTFITPVDLSVYQNYNFKIFAKYSVDVNLNDTVSTTVYFRRPNLDLGDDVNTGSGDYIIDAGAGFDTYLWWFDNSEEQTYTVNVNNQSANHYYPVTVTNSYGCSATDSILVSFNTTPDLELSTLVSPVSDCLTDDTYAVEVVITNTGALNIASGTNIGVRYKIDNGTVVSENKVLSSALNAGATVNHIFAGTISFPTAKTYSFKTYISYASDVTHSNDTLISSVVINSPNFNFSNDTIKVTAYPYVLDAGSWSGYLWQNGSTGRQFTVTADGLYKCTITDALGCNANDSVYVMITTGIDGIISGENFIISYYPNPVNDELKIQIDAFKPIELKVEILNQHGQIIFNNQFKNNGQAIEKINVSNHAQGLYYIRFIIDNQVFVRKIVIQ